jgi:hypothetical protein
MKKDYRAKDFQKIIECFNSAEYYPLFLVDEFYYIKSLLDRKIIHSAFLANLGQLSLSDQAGFLFAGTYDIKELIEEKEYGITGQLVHAIDCQIDKIDDQAAEELITVLKEKLVFTREAISHIKRLSGNIPYFIQIICKYCGYYAVEKKDTQSDIRSLKRLSVFYAAPTVPIIKLLYKSYLKMFSRITNIALETPYALT